MYHLYTDMPLIEGIGDEVTVVFTILFLFLIVCIAWVSTNIRELPFFSVIVIEFTRRQNRNQPASNSQETAESSSASSSSSDESVSELAVGPTTEESENVTSSSSKDSQNEQSAEINSQINDTEVSNEEQSNSTEESHAVAEASSQNASVGKVSDEQSVSTSEETTLDSDDLPATETELRRRRVEFFSGQTTSASSEPLKGNNEQKLESEHSCEKSLSKSAVTSTTSEVKSKNSTESVVDTGNANVGPTDDTNETDTADTSSGQNDRVRIRLKYLNDTQRFVVASLDDTVEQFRRAHFAEELAANKLVRFIFNGQDLRNDANTLQAYNIVDNSVIHCLITQANRQNTSSARDHDGEGFDMGMLMLPCFGLILCFTWYLRFEYRQFFSGTSTVCLIGITLLFIAAMLATWENRRRGHHHVHVD